MFITEEESLSGLYPGKGQPQRTVWLLEIVKLPAQRSGSLQATSWKIRKRLGTILPSGVANRTRKVPGDLLIDFTLPLQQLYHLLVVVVVVVVVAVVIVVNSRPSNFLFYIYVLCADNEFTMVMKLFNETFSTSFQDGATQPHFLNSSTDGKAKVCASNMGFKERKLLLLQQVCTTLHPYTRKDRHL